MDQRTQSGKPRPGPGGRDSGCKGRGHLLIVEPEPLLQWSLGTYFSRWFEVFVADSAATAQSLLDGHSVDALVVSDELPDHAAERVEARARLRNSSVLVVRTVTGVSEVRPAQGGTHCVEKPFDLAKLADILGVHAGCEDPPSGSAE